MKTTVIHHKDVASFDHDQIVYIGRPSKWGNPFVVGRQPAHIRLNAINRYEEYVRTNPTLMAALSELRGKALVCHCKPRACHGDVLVKLLKERGLE
jgi:hypothetical protein